DASVDPDSEAIAIEIAGKVGAFAQFAFQNRGWLPLAKHVVAVAGPPSRAVELVEICGTARRSGPSGFFRQRVDNDGGFVASRSEAPALLLGIADPPNAEILGDQPEPETMFENLPGNYRRNNQDEHHGKAANPPP